MFITSSATLTNGSTYSSGSVVTDRTDRIVGSVFADQNGVLYIEQSFDGTNWDISTSYNITANNGEGFSEELVAPYARIRFNNNSGSNQGAFRLFAKSSSAGDS
jgi:hypothetical protein